MRTHENDCQESKSTDAAPIAAEKRRPFPEPTLTKHDRVTRITLVSNGDFTGGGLGGGGFGGGTFF